VPNGEKVTESLKTKGRISHSSSAPKPQDCAKSGTMAQLSGGWRKLLGAVGSWVNNQETKEQSGENLSSLLCSFVVQIICSRV
jgi:hypothetical protein